MVISMLFLSNGMKYRGTFWRLIFAEECLIVRSLNLPYPELYNEGWRVHVSKYDVSVRPPVHTSNTERDSQFYQDRRIFMLCCDIHNK